MPNTDAERKLLSIIRIQTRIAEAPLELETVMQIVAETAESLTEADMRGSFTICR